MQTLFRKLKNELNEDELLHFAVVRISFPVNGYFPDTSKYLNIVFKDCLILNNLPTLQTWTIFTWQFYCMSSSTRSENHHDFYPVSHRVEVVYYDCEHQKVYIWMPVC